MAQIATFAKGCGEPSMLLVSDWTPTRLYPFRRIPRVHPSNMRDDTNQYLLRVRSRMDLTCGLTQYIVSWIKTGTIIASEFASNTFSTKTKCETLSMPAAHDLMERGVSSMVRTTTLERCLSMPKLVIALPSSEAYRFRC